MAQSLKPYRGTNVYVLDPTPSSLGGATINANFQAVTDLALTTGTVNAENYGLILGTDTANAASNTVALNNAIAALPNGGLIDLPVGVIVFTSLVIPAEIPLIFQGRGCREQASYGIATGTELRSTIADGTTPAISITSFAGAPEYGADSAAKVCFRDLYLRCSGDPSGAGIGHRNNSHGFFISHAHHGELSNVFVAGYDGHGVHIDTGYWWELRNCYVSGCGTGYWGSSANTSLLLNCRADFNSVGVNNMQRCVSLTCESNTLYGYQCSGTLDYSLHDIWFENNAVGGGGSDLFADNFANLSVTGHARLSQKFTGSYNLTATNFANVSFNGVLRFNSSPGEIHANLDTNAILVENTVGNSFLGFTSATNGATYLASTIAQTETDAGTTQGYALFPPGGHFVGFNSLPVGGFQNFHSLACTTSANIPLGYEVSVRVGTTSTTCKMDGSGSCRGNGGAIYTCNSGGVLNGGDILRFEWQFPCWKLISITKYS